MKPAHSARAPTARRRAQHIHPSPRHSEPEPVVSRGESPANQKLRELIFPTLYAIFQQIRAQRCNHKIKNRSLRSLTRSCLYHNREDQLQRTLTDAEALLSKYCVSNKQASATSYTSPKTSDTSTVVSG